MNDRVESIRDFYNSVAAEYNGHMTDSDRKTRGVVKDLFVKCVAPGNILDFGGGTGLDIPWLLENNYNVFFLEPSENMRSEARKNKTPGNVNFIESNTDFNAWNENKLPFDQKMNGIVANFAVLNCIENIDSLFEKLALVSNPGCCMMATVIDPGILSMTRNYSALAAMRMFLQPKLTVYNKYRNDYHPTYVHSLRTIKRSCLRYFSLKSVTSLGSSSFVILTFERK